MYHFAFRFFRDESLADEVVHKTFIKIWERRVVLKDVSSCKNYIFSINRNMILQELRDISRDQKKAEAFALRIVNSHNSVEEGAIYKNLKEIAQEAIDQLPRKRKEIFTLSRQQGFSHKEIAAKLNISENTVKVSVSKSLKQIREYMRLHTDMTLFLLVYYAFID